jgi:hypothetical protein
VKTRFGIRCPRYACLALTVSLNGVMCNAAQHGEAFLFRHLEALAHPREEMGQAEVPTSDAFGDARAPGCEGEGANRIWPERNARRVGRKRLVRPEHIRAVDQAAVEHALVRKL